jgi:hypothetical protein
MPAQDDLVTLAPNALVGNGRYRVGEEINRGGTAVVYEGYDNTLGMRVALKVRVRLSPRARLLPPRRAFVPSTRRPNPLTASRPPPAGHEHRAEQHHRRAAQGGEARDQVRL